MCRTPRYSGSGRAVQRAGAALLLAALLPGCASLSFQMGSLLGDDDKKPEVTGSVAKPAADRMPVADLTVAKGAVGRAMAVRETGTSVPWENPSTGARGSVTPLAGTHQQTGLTCRTFLLSHVAGERETWHQGEACRIGADWEVQSVRSLQKTG